MGVGLSISKRIVEAHGGKISVTRNDNGGATFRFTLPTIEDDVRNGDY
jgi:two-component system sensor kinase FixL